jgi:hypothetical protein
MGSPAAKDRCLLTRIFSMPGKKLNIAMGKNFRRKIKFHMLDIKHVKNQQNFDHAIWTLKSCKNKVL